MLDPREHIRRRPGMYIGGTDSKAFHNMLFVVIDRSVNSAIAGYCDNISITLLPDNRVKIQDNDIKIPQQAANNEYAPFIEHTNSNYYLRLWYQIPVFLDNGRDLQAGGLDQITVMTVSALSAYMDIVICHNDFAWKASYRDGQLYGASQKYHMTEPQSDGVTITFQPDFTIMDKNEFDYDRIATRCREIAYALPDLTITLIDERSTSHRQDVFHYPDGIKALVSELNEGKTLLHDLMYVKGIVPLKTHDGEEDIHVEIALQFTDSDDITIHSYVNSVRLDYGGTHVEGLKYALSGYLNASRSEPLAWEETAGGLTAVVNVLYPDYGLYYEGYPTIS